VYLYDNPAFKSAINIALTRLNFEMSGHGDVSWVNDTPGMDIPDFKFNQETAHSMMGVAGGVRVGQRVPSEKARHILVMST